TISFKLTVIKTNFEKKSYIKNLNFDNELTTFYSALVFGYYKTFQFLSKRKPSRVAIRFSIIDYYNLLSEK
ncbi:hypothetical protein BpHYR1_035850, partial [Brachionus plicatilis]